MYSLPPESGSQRLTLTCIAGGILALLAVALLTACAPAPPTAPATFRASSYRGFLATAPLLPFRLDGAIVLTYRGERETGAVHVQADADPAYRLTLNARITGALALEVRFDPVRLLVVDYVNETYVQAPNTAANRLRLFEMDLDPAEFQTLLTGRVPRERFEAGAGRIGPVPTSGGSTPDLAAALASTDPGTATAVSLAEYHAGGAVHRFLLDHAGLPLVWTKSVRGVEAFRVEYREYLEVSVNGTVLRLPRKVRLYQGAPAPVLVLGVREVLPGVNADGPIDPRRLPEGARDFVRLDVNEFPLPQ